MSLPPKTSCINFRVPKKETTGKKRKQRIIKKKKCEMVKTIEDKE